MRIPRERTDRWLAGRLAEIDRILDLHRAGMAPVAVSQVRERLARVRRELERRVAHKDSVSDAMRLVPKRARAQVFTGSATGSAADTGGLTGAGGGAGALAAGFDGGGADVSAA